MKLTTRMRYGTRALVDLALHQAKAPIPSHEIAQRQQVSLKYLEGILITLRNAGLVRTIRGASGGYTLARDPAQIPLTEVFDALEGPEPLVPCTDDLNCPRYDVCVTREIWARMYAACRQVLEGITIAELAAKAREKQANTRGLYEI
jgi:Rrf2 family protein